MGDLVEQLVEVVGPANVLTGTEVHDDYIHDEALTATPVVPLAVVRPGCTAEVVGILKVAEENADPGRRPGQRDRALGGVGARGPTGSWSRSSG